MADKEWELFEKEELHKTALNAFVNNQITSDRLLLGINIASIGFISKFILDMEIYDVFDKSIIYLLLFSVLFLVISSYKILKIFDRNKIYLQNILKGNTENDIILDKLDKQKINSFSIGMIFFFIALIIIGIKKLYWE